MNEFKSLHRLISRHARRTPDAAALISSGVAISWSELDAAINRTAAALRASGVSEGVVVAAHLGDPLAFTAVFVATLRLRAVFVPLPTNITAESLRVIVTDCAPRLIVAEDEGILVERRDFDGETAVVAYASLASAASARLAPDECRPEDRATILYSSGTTSRPKGVVHSHGARHDSQLRFIRRYGVTGRTVTLIATPLYTSMTWASFLATLHAGGTTVVMPTFETDEFFRVAAQYSTTLALLVPTQYAMLLEHNDRSFERFDCLVVGGAKTDRALFERVMIASGGKLVEQLGSTETEAICCLPSRAPQSKWGSVGVPLPGVSIKVVGSDNREVPAGQVGEISVHSSSLMLGYHGAVEDEARFWRDPETSLRYYKMGDLGAIDADGYLWVRGRSKDLIISAGFNIYPSDIESTLLQHPLVRRAAVVGMPSKVLGEVPVAFAETTSAAATESELCRWANARLGDRQRLYCVKLVDRLPTNASGKIVRAALRDFLAAAPGEIPSSAKREA